MRKTDEELMKSLFHRYCGDVAEDLNKLGIHVDRNSALGGIIASLYEKENNKNIRSVEVKVEDKRRKKSDKELIQKLDERKKHDFVKKENRVHTKKSDKELIDRLNNREVVHTCSKNENEINLENFYRKGIEQKTGVSKKVTVYGIEFVNNEAVEEELFTTDIYTIEYTFHTGRSGVYTLNCIKAGEDKKTQFQFNYLLDKLQQYSYDTNKRIAIETVLLDEDGNEVSSFRDTHFHVYSAGYSEKDNNYNIVFKK